jgi:hypothetical protein
MLNNNDGAIRHNAADYERLLQSGHSAAELVGSVRGSCVYRHLAMIKHLISGFFVAGKLDNRKIHRTTSMIPNIRVYFVFSTINRISKDFHCNHIFTATRFSPHQDFHRTKIFTVLLGY